MVACMCVGQVMAVKPLTEAQKMALPHDLGGKLFGLQFKIVMQPRTPRGQELHEKISTLEKQIEKDTAEDKNKIKGDIKKLWGKDTALRKKAMALLKNHPKHVELEALRKQIEKDIEKDKSVIQKKRAALTNQISGLQVSIATLGNKHPKYNEISKLRKEVKVLLDKKLHESTDYKKILEKAEKYFETDEGKKKLKEAVARKKKK